MSSKGRGRLSSIDLMPAEADGIIQWASRELAARERTQTDIYSEFVTRCEQLMAEHRGELEFRIPAFSSFNRYSIRQARLTRRLDQTRAITTALADRFDPTESDNLTIMAAETVKALVLQMLGEVDEDSIDARSVMQLATAFRQAVQAQSISTDRKIRAEAAFAEQVDEAVTAVARTRGLTAETAEAIKSQILGVG